MAVSTKFDMREDDNVIRNYGRMLIELSSAIPDGIVSFFVSYSYMDKIISKWNEMGILQVFPSHLVCASLNSTVNGTQCCSWAEIYLCSPSQVSGASSSAPKSCLLESPASVSRIPGLSTQMVLESFIILQMQDKQAKKGHG